MADPVTQNRGLVIPNTGSSPGSWGPIINGDFAILDTIVGGIASISTNGGPTTLSPAQLACGTISITGNMNQYANIIFPAVQGWWSIENLTTNGFPVFIQSVGGAQQICMPPGEITDIQIGSSGVKYRNLGRVGSYLDLATASVPQWIANCTIPPYLLCDGSSFSATTYPQLVALIGTNITPDLRGRSRAMLNLSTNRITGAVTGINGDALFAAGGVQTSTLVTANLPQHTHSGTTGVDSPDHGHNVAGGGSNGVTYSPGAGAYVGFAPSTALSAGANVRHAHAFTTDGGTGSNTAFSIMQPTTISGITLIRAA